MSKHVTIIGTDEIGLAAVADLSQRGFTVTLYVPEDEPLGERLVEEPTIFFNGERVDFHRVESNLAEALQASSLIFITATGWNVESIARQCAPFLTDNHRVVLFGHGALASLRFKQVTDEMETEADYVVGETDSPPYEIAYDEKTGELELILRSKKMLFSSYPKSDHPMFLRELRACYPSMTEAENIWEVLLNNRLPETVVVPVLSNLSTIEMEIAHFQLYREGISETVARLMQEVDEERKKLVRSMRFEDVGIERRLVESGHVKPLDELMEQMQESNVFNQLPRTKVHMINQFMEGLLFGVVPWLSLARLLSIETPTLDSLLQLSSVALDRMIEQEGLTLDKVGFFKGNAEALNQSVKEERHNPDEIVLN